MYFIYKIPQAWKRWSLTKTLGVPLGNEAFSSVEKNRANSWDKFSFYWKCLLLRRGKEWKKRKRLFMAFCSKPSWTNFTFALFVTFQLWNGDWPKQCKGSSILSWTSLLNLKTSAQKNPNTAWTWTSEGVGTCQDWTQGSSFNSPARMQLRKGKEIHF